MTTALIILGVVLILGVLALYAERRTAKKLHDVKRLSDPNRLAAVFEYLESQMSDAFDILCSRAAEALDVPVCEFNVVTNDRQFHIGKYPPTGNRSDPIQDSGCRFVVMKEGVVAITDCASDPDFYDLLGVRSGAFASYLGVPLCYKGEIIGSFCIADSKPREWTLDELTTLRSFAVQTGLAHD